jgi:hypothetical protein
MRDGRTQKEVADATESAVYSAPMSEAKQNHEAMLQLTDTFEPEQNIAFGSRRIAKSTGKVGPHYLAAVSKREVWSWIPELWRYEMAKSETCYWMLQPLWPDLCKRGELPTEENGFRPQWFPARSGSVAAFANVAIDLDVGRPNLPTSGAAIGLMADAVQAGRIPAPSFMAHSGRGAYAIWQLRQTVPNTPANRTRWRAILLKLVSLTDTLGLAPDGNATKQGQWLKVPGTLDTKTQNRVLYLPFMLNGAAPSRYSLDELETALGLLPAPDVPAIAPDVPAIAPAPDRIKRTPRLNARHGGYVHSARITEIVALSNSRGGMAEGVRYMTLYHYYASCRAEYACMHPSSGLAHAWAVQKTVELNATFSPPLPADEVLSAARQPSPKEGRVRIWQANTIAKRLQVAPSEADALGLRAIAPASVRKRQKEHDQVMAKSRHEARLQRADAIRALIAKHPKWSDLDISRELGGVVDRKTVANHRAQMERTMPDISTAHQRELPGFSE